MIVRQVANVLELIEFFAARGRPATLTEISDALGWPRSSTFNIVATLSEKGYLYEPRIRGGYYPSPRWSVVMNAIQKAEPLPEAVRKLGEEIADRTGETTAVSSLSGMHTNFLHVVDSRHPIRFFTEVGKGVPVHASSAGRAILGQLGRQEREAIYRRIVFERFSETTPMSVEAIEQALKDAAARGYHQSNSEYIPDLAGVSLPLEGGMKHLSIVVAGPVSRCLAKRPETAEIMKDSVRKFGLEMPIVFQP